VSAKKARCGHCWCSDMAAPQGVGPVAAPYPEKTALMMRRARNSARANFGARTALDSPRTPPARPSWHLRFWAGDSDRRWRELSRLRTLSLAQCCQDKRRGAFAGAPLRTEAFNTTHASMNEFAPCYGGRNVGDSARSTSRNGRSRLVLVETIL
jgi:hypothetical protein